jgi:hypothetical protein
MMKPARQLQRSSGMRQVELGDHDRSRTRHGIHARASRPTFLPVLFVVLVRFASLLVVNDILTTDLRWIGLS